MSATVQLLFIHDPMCSWCWGFRPAFAALRSRLPDDVGVVRLLGGLAPDSDQAMAESMQHKLQQTWRQIQQRIPGTQFNFDFWRECKPRRSTYPACRAVLAARALDPLLEEAMIEAIQRAYYLQARNPSDDDTLIDLAVRLGLNSTEFAARLGGEDTQKELDAEIAEARRIGADSFPSLRLRIDDAVHSVPVDYTNADRMLSSVTELLVSG